jgi:hypothetical protein
MFVIFTPHSYSLSYLDSKQLATEIEEDNPKNFNIADQLTGDNRATILRYLLTVQRFAPQGVTEYTNVKTLFIYANVPLSILLKNRVYEIKSFLPFKSVSTSEISDHIFLYKLRK